jgi:type VI secretion system protein ImpH
VIRRLLEAPQEFGFFQAVRLLELARPDAVPLGHSGPASQEAVRLCSSSSLAFQASELTAIEAPLEAGQPYQLTTTVLGLYGTSSPLPGFYSEEILHYEPRRGAEDDPVRLFLDVFNHRVLSLAYRAWAKYRWVFSFRTHTADPISRAMLHLIGLGEPSARDLLGVPAQRLLRYAGYITQQPRNAVGLAGVLADYFDGVPVRVEQCLERWVSVAPDDRNSLGTAQCVLGASLTLGERVLDRSGKFGLHVGPLERLADFVDFLPGGHRSSELRALLGFLVPDPLEYELALGLAASEVPLLQLGCDSESAALGRTTWLCTERVLNDKWEHVAGAGLEPAAAMGG